ncbi:hypothetical protein ACFFUP_05635 [Vibrio ostreicida]|uniref:DUF2645 family protein n=1 Tax=Vibrio ostreicida TaxID=526588 RepID=A0ABT8BU13_9VIBR|nr:hypothetical protein [Vibrio ostreicida]MDN3609563.1 hypothetical protein [Vibrio ostreicida]NPD08437.1 hypothetical protein [Vibrio ostreicida]
MSKIFRYSLLLIPLFFLGLTWLGVVFGIDPIPDGFLRDDTYEYSGDGKKPTGLISQNLFDSISIVAMIPGFFIGSIYTVYKRLWWWFGGYMVLGFGFWVYLGY